MAITETLSTLLIEDRAAVWHPFTQMQTAAPPLAIVRGKGSYLYTEDGSAYLDAISSWYVNLHGHAHPYIVQKIAEQAALLEHVLFADCTHPGAVALATRLLSLLPGPMGKIFYSDNGATSVEAALKIAIQYWDNLKTPKKKVVCFRHSYHGDTFGAMSAAGKNLFNRPFWGYLFDAIMIDPPFDGEEQRSLDQLERALKGGEVACFIFEPLILGVGGMRIYSAEGLDLLLNYCRTHDVLTIADEVMTGFGRTGPLFATDLLTETPDIICLSKGLTGGFLPLGVTACKETIYEAFLSVDPSKAFLHGHSYTANPLACSAALASLDLLLTQECTEQRERIHAQHQDFCTQWKGHPRLKRCETLGTILAVEYKTESTHYFHQFGKKLTPFFLQKGILLRPIANVLHLMPPYCIEEHELAWIYEQIAHTLEGNIS